MTNRITIVFFLLFFGLKISAQAKLALTVSQYDSAIRNACLVSDLLIKQKGDEWYNTNILKTTDLGICSFCMKANCNGQIFISAPRIKNKEIVVALEDIANYIEKHHLTIYVSCGIPFRMESKGDIEKSIKQYLDYYKNTEFYFLCGCCLWPSRMEIKMSDNWYKKYYVEDEKKAGRNPKSHIEWLKEKIDYYLSLPIKSSLDYGITNEDFCPQQQ